MTMEVTISQIPHRVLRLSGSMEANMQEAIAVLQEAFKVQMEYLKESLR